MSVAEKTRQLWIEKGYEHFALYGPENLSINKISKEIESPRASFYHHYGDIDIFIDELLDLHWEISKQLNLTLKKECENFYPDLLVLLAQNPILLKFSKQLFINRDNPIYNYLFVKAYHESANFILLKLFSKQYGLKNNKETLNLLVTVGESWYSRLDTNDLSAEKMQQIATDVMNSVLKFVSSDLYSKIQENR